MPGLLENNGPNYISSHSADVILSEARPIKLKIEALRSINVFLDEFLYKILSASRSLHTDKLRSSLLGVLPTASGKEALLEAEVEIRAYWERTNPGNHSPPVLDDDGKTFTLDWSFEVLRMKCEAYSTLNDSDEDPLAESRLYERMVQAGGIVPPKQALVAPAALYLTAILEAICERILANVGRVVARDSSRTGATVQDLFTALCEDDSLYGTFRAMKVYQQIESLSKAPKPRRSKSFTRSDKSRTSSPHQDISVSKDTTINGAQRSRLSSETTPFASSPPTNSAPRTSFDRARSMKNFRPTWSTEGDGQNSHKKTNSLMSEETKGSNGGSEEKASFEDAAMLQEFDDLMRSDATMKVSLTPDRLRTMEVYKQEKDQRGGRRPAPLSLKPDSEPTQPLRANGRKPPLHGVDSIVEDDEESTAKVPGRHRQASVSAQPSPSTIPPAGNRTRSISNPGRSVGARLVRKSSRNRSGTPETPLSPPTSFAFPANSTMPALVQSRGGPELNKPFGAADRGTPARTRKIQRNRESLDLDDVMAGSDDDEQPAFNKSPAPAKPPQAPRFAVSSQTKELMDFLAEGPPDTIDLQGPSNQNGSSISIDLGKPKGSGRLQRMMSKLALGGSDKSRSGSEDFRGSPKSSLAYRGTAPKLSSTSISALANRPIPPRPALLSPPSSPSQDSADENTQPPFHSRTTSLSQRTHVEQKIAENTKAPSPVLYTRGSQPVANGHTKVMNGEPLSPSANRPAVNGNVVNGHSAPFGEYSSLPVTPPGPSASSPPATPSRLSRKPVPSPASTSTGPHISLEVATDMHRLFATASNADECRVILDMFLARAGIPLPPVTPIEGPSHAVVYPLAPQRDPTAKVDGKSAEDDTALEHTLVDMFLNDTKPHYVRNIVEQAKATNTSNEKPEAVVTPPHSPLPAPTPPTRSSKREAMIGLSSSRQSPYATPALSPVSLHTTS
ncbi:hypothetical protein BDN72DRAFT_957648 [Pluteus cervinus]|uniref:Uncharacterized protein n=1 Tax=Pluteus cervinus TaxID=181527 RepID=A0ACD3B1U3_9AGAR|nr:hypothetical protein BDN72DRAFT_957648 [Pluteus cervinus]